MLMTTGRPASRSPHMTSQKSLANAVPNLPRGITYDPERGGAFRAGPDTISGGMARCLTDRGAIGK